MNHLGIHAEAHEASRVKSGRRSLALSESVVARMAQMQQSLAAVVATGLRFNPTELCSDTSVIIQTMRHWILIFLIALTPLRAWASGDMATQMAAQQAVQQSFIATANIANYVYLTGTSDRFDSKISDLTRSSGPCSGHASKTEDTSYAPQADSTNHTDHAAFDHISSTADEHAKVHCVSACGACQVCHSVAFANDPVWLLQALPDLSAVISTAPRFTSADRALGLKPPIS